MVLPAWLKRYQSLSSHPLVARAVNIEWISIYSVPEDTALWVWFSVRVCSCRGAARGVRNWQDKDHFVQTLNEQKMREVKSNANLDIAMSNAETSIRLEATGVTGATAVSVNCRRVDWVDAGSIDFRFRDAIVDWSQDIAAWIATKHSHDCGKSHR